MKKLILILTLVLLVSGCVGMPDLFKGIIPGTEGPEVKELGPDIIVIQNLNIIPNPPINANDQFSVSFEIKNQDDINPVNNVGYNLFDWGICRPPDTGRDGIKNFAPLQTDFIEWTFTAPSNPQMGGLSVTCPIRFKVNYSYTTRSQIDVDVISLERLKELQRAGEMTTVTPTLSVGRGPVKVYLSFGASLPIKNESILPVYITVEDKGTGLLGSIKKKTLTIKADNFTEPDCINIFNCDNFDSTHECYNNDTIPLIKKKTYQLRCTFKTPKVSIQRTFYITASLNYTYDLTQEVNIEVRPSLT